MVFDAATFSGVLDELEAVVPVTDYIEVAFVSKGAVGDVEYFSGEVPADEFAGLVEAIAGVVGCIAAVIFNFCFRTFGERDVVEGSEVGPGEFVIVCFNEFV